MAAEDSNFSDSSKSEFYQNLIKHEIPAKVAQELESIQKQGLLGLDGIDKRAMDAIKEFNVEQALEVLQEFKNFCKNPSNMDHNANKSALICSLMKTYRQKQRGGEGGGNSLGGGSGASNKKPGPDEAKLKAILDRTGYSLEVTTGQRKYGGPPPNWEGAQPGPGHEVFCGKVPKDVFEDELIPLFEKCGPLWDLRLMMDPLTGLNRGFCFVTFKEKDSAQEAVRLINGHDIKPGKQLKVNQSVANVRLFVGNIPKNKSKEDIFEEFKKHTEGLVDVIIYSSPDDLKKKNRGFAFLEYDNHKSASIAKHRLGSGYTRVWSCDIIVDWADPQEQPDDDTMSKVKVLYVRNLKSDVTEEQLKEKFEKYGRVERVKKIKDYGFVHFEDRDNALKALQELNGKKVGESEMQISLAKPPTENKAKEKRKQQYKFQRYDDFLQPYPGHMMPPPIRGGRGMPRPPLHGRMGFRPPPHLHYLDYEYGGYYGGGGGGGYSHGGHGSHGGLGSGAGSSAATAGSSYKDYSRTASGSAAQNYTEDYDYYGLHGGAELDHDYSGYSSGIGAYLDVSVGHGGTSGRGRGGPAGGSSRGGSYPTNHRGGYWNAGPIPHSGGYMPQWSGGVSAGGARGHGGQWGGSGAPQRR